MFSLRIQGDEDALLLGKRKGIDDLKSLPDGCCWRCLEEIPLVLEIVHICGDG